MMKRCVVVSLLFALLIPSTALAGDKDIAVFGTVHDGEDDPGWGAGARLSFDILDWLAIETRAGWVGWISATAKGAPGEFDVDIVPIDLGGAINLWPHGPIKPFVNGGATWAWLDPEKGDHDDDWGWYVGGGAEFPLTKRDRYRARAKEKRARRSERRAMSHSESGERSYAAEERRTVDRDYERGYPPREDDLDTGPALFFEVLYRELDGRLDTNDLLLDGRKYNVDGAVGNVGLSWRW